MAANLLNPTNYLDDDDFTYNDIISKINDGKIVALIYRDSDNSASIYYLKSCSQIETGTQLKIATNSSNYTVQFYGNLTFIATDPDDIMTL